jgi:hypothetical protein
MRSDKSKFFLSALKTLCGLPSMIRLRILPDASPYSFSFSKRCGWTIGQELSDVTANRFSSS